MGQLYGFDEESAGRIVAAVEAVEGAKGNYRPPKYRPPGKANPPEVQDIRVTSATLGANGYPAKIQQVQNGAGGVTYTDLGDCYALDPNSGSLSTSKYTARRTGNAPDGKPVFTVVNTAGSLTIKNASGSVTITGVTTIVLNPDGDWSITNPQPGVAQITLNGLTVNRTYVTNVTCDSSGNLVLTTATDVFRDGLLVG